MHKIGTYNFTAELVFSADARPTSDRVHAI